MLKKAKSWTIERTIKCLFVVELILLLPKLCDSLPALMEAGTHLTMALAMIEGIYKRNGTEQ